MQEESTYFSPLRDRRDATSCDPAVTLNNAVTSDDVDEVAAAHELALQGRCWSPSSAQPRHHSSRAGLKQPRLADALHFDLRGLGSPAEAQAVAGAVWLSALSRHPPPGHDALGRHFEGRLLRAPLQACARHLVCGAWVRSAQLDRPSLPGSLRSRLLACDERDCLVGVAGVVS